MAERALPEFKGRTIVVEQVGSAIRCPKDQHETLVGLGLGKTHRRRELPNTRAVRGMIAKLPHLVRVVESKS